MYADHKTTIPPSPNNNIINSLLQTNVHIHVKK